MGGKKKVTNDDFLYSFRKAPSEEFSQSLYQHLIQEDERQRRKQRNKLFITSTIAALILLFGAVSIPGVRAAIFDSLVEIAGIQFMETTEYPGDDDVTTIPYTLMELDLARDKFNLSLPKWAPEGYVIDKMIQGAKVDGSYRHLIITWNKPGEPSIHLEVMLQESTIVVGPESVQNLEIDGRDVAVWQGGWNFDEKKWDDSIGAITLSWSDDGKTAYHLSGMDGESSFNDLVTMIESIP
jgi:hypothetical protein